MSFVSSGVSIGVFFCLSLISFQDPSSCGIGGLTQLVACLSVCLARSTFLFAMVCWNNSRVDSKTWMAWMPLALVKVLKFSVRGK